MTLLVYASDPADRVLVKQFATVAKANRMYPDQGDFIEKFAEIRDTSVEQLLADVGDAAGRELDRSPDVELMELLGLMRDHVAEMNPAAAILAAEDGA